MSSKTKVYSLLLVIADSTGGPKTVPIDFAQIALVSQFVHTNAQLTCSTNAPLFSALRITGTNVETKAIFYQCF
jgi:hypothetical protein